MSVASAATGPVNGMLTRMASSFSAATAERAINGAVRPKAVPVISVRRAIGMVHFPTLLPRIPRVGLALVNRAARARGTTCIVGILHRLTRFAAMSQSK
jgi:hypothetical protein